MDNDESGGCLGLLGLGLIIFFLYQTWPIGIFLCLSAGLWLWSRGSSRLWIQAIAYVFSAVTIGLAILCVALFVLNALKSTLDPSWVYSAEEALYILLLHLKSINSSKVVTILILLALTAFTYYMPQWKLLDKFLFLKKALAKTIIVLATITSFTFFGQIPMNAWASQAHEKMVERYRAALRQQWQFEGQYMAARALEAHVRDLPEPKRFYYRTVYSTIKSEAVRDGTDYSVPVSEHMADLQSERTKEVLKSLSHQADQDPARSAVELPDEKLMQNVAETAKERKRQIETLAQQELRTKAAEAKAADAFKGLKKVFSEVITSQIPGVDGVAGIYLKKLVSNYSEHFFEKSVERFHRSAAQAGTKAPVLAAEMVQAATPEPQLAKELLEPRLATGMTELSIAAAATPLLRKRIAQEVGNMTRAEASSAISKEIARRTAASTISAHTSTGRTSGPSRRPPIRPRPRGR